MKNKAIIITISAAVTLFLLCSCGKAVQNQPEKETEATNPAPYTTVVDGKTLTAQRLNSGDGSYQVGCYDEEGRGVRLEYYKNGKLCYYYTSEFLSEDGGEVQRYYNAQNELLARVENGEFYSASGEKITEDKMEEILSRY